MRSLGWTHSLEDYGMALERAGLKLEAIREPRPSDGPRAMKGGDGPTFPDGSVGQGIGTYRTHFGRGRVGSGQPPPTRRTHVSDVSVARRGSTDGLAPTRATRPRRGPLYLSAIAGSAKVRLK